MAQITPLSEFPSKNDSGQVTITAPIVQLIVANSGTVAKQLLLVRKGDGGYFTIVAVVNAEPSPDGKGVETLVNNYESAEYSVIQPNGTIANLDVYLDSIATSNQPLPAGAATESTLAALSAKLPPVIGPQAKANALAVTFATDIPALNVNVGSTTDRSATGDITSTQSVELSTQGCGTIGLQLSNTWTGTAVFEATVDGSLWRPYYVDPTTGSGAVASTTANGAWSGPCAGFQKVRITGASIGSGTATAFLNASTATTAVVLGDSLPPGSNAIGSVSVSSSALPSGASTAAKQDTGNTSLASLDTKAPALVSGRVPTDGSGVTQPISVASGQEADGHSLTLGATTDASTANTVIGRLQKLVSLLAGGFPTALSGAGNLKVVVNEALSVAVSAVSGNVATTNAATSQADGHSVTLGTTSDASSALTVIGLLKAIKALLASVPVTGTFWQATQPVSSASGSQVDGHSETIGSISDASSASTLVGLLKNIKSALAGSLAVTGTFWQATQPVSGTVATTSALASQADGHSATLGALADSSSASTVIGLLKNIKAALAGSVAVTGTFWQATQPVSGTVTATPSGTQAISVASGQEVDGHSANIGTLADTSSASTLTGLLKNIKAALAGTLSVVGAAAAGAALSGNPVVVAGSDGTSVRYLALDSTGRFAGSSRTFITTNVTTQVIKSGNGVLRAIVVNPGVTSAFLLYDSSGAASGQFSGAGTTSPAYLYTIQYGPNGVAFTNGLVITTSGGTPAQLLVIYD